MAERLDLGAAVKSIETPLSEALGASEATFLSGFDADVRLAYPRCGLVTACMQLLLRDYGYETERLRIRKKITSPAHRDNDVDHVYLRGEGHIIDPTYTQYYGHIGLSAHVLNDNPDARSLMPDDKIAVFDQAKVQQFAMSLTDHQIDIRPAARTIYDQHETELLQHNRGMIYFPETPLFLATTPAHMLRYYYTIWSSIPNGFPFSFDWNARNNQRRYNDCVEKVVAETRERSVT
tara:strand:+ start:260 stop:964 length:705 start_codon:yes stop_codon:yes gene_type:complete